MRTTGALSRGGPDALWNDHARLYRVNKDGSGEAEPLHPELRVGHMALGKDAIYAIGSPVGRDAGTAYRLPLSGGAPEPLAKPHPRMATQVVVDDAHVYWGGGSLGQFKENYVRVARPDADPAQLAAFREAEKAGAAAAAVGEPEAVADAPAAGQGGRCYLGSWAASRISPTSAELGKLGAGNMKLVGQDGVVKLSFEEDRKGMWDGRFDAGCNGDVLELKATAAPGFLSALHFARR